jgi:endonuclease YncB( thermonuclease family)
LFSGGFAVRTAYKVWSGIAAGVFCVVAVTDMATMSPTAPPAPAVVAAAPSPGVTLPGPSVPASPLVAAAPVPAGELVSVTKVVDGDTIVVAGGRQVRLLGIDACEMSTKGGREAKETLVSYLGGEQVRLVADGRRDVDDYGRLLRRVERASSSPSAYDPYNADVGVMLITDDAVGIYDKGRNDATQAYLSVLRPRDYGVRNCAGTPEVTSYDYESDGDGGRNMPDGALTGGYCARKWWC